MKWLLGLNIVLTLAILLVVLNHSRQIDVFDKNGEITREVIRRDHERLKAVEQYLHRALPTPSPSP